MPDAEAFTRWELAELGVYDALSVTDGSGVTVAVLDSGIDRAHSAFADADIAAGYDAVAHRPGVDGDASGHGTKVAGILAARFSGAEETLGAAPGVTLYPIKVSEDGQTLYTSSLIYALHLAADAGVDVINMSLGGYFRSEAEADAVEYAHRRGCILVAAAGNEGGDETYAGRYSYPASYDHVISVGAYGQDGLICGFSQHNDALDVVAPGEALTLVAAGSDGYVTDAGTSFACAYVSAAPCSPTGSPWTATSWPSCSNTRSAARATTITATGSSLCRSCSPLPTGRWRSAFRTARPISRA